MWLIIMCIALLSVTTDVSEGTLTRLPDGLTLQKGKMTWEEARDQCEREGGVIASPINDKALSAMKSVIGEQNITYYTGIKATDLPGQFVSIEGVPLKNMPLTVTLDMVQELDPWEGECLAMSRDSIRSVPCTSRLPYMCYNTHVFNMNITNCGPNEQGYKFHVSSGNCYKLHTEPRCWDQALMACVTEGAHLAIIKNAEEAQFIKNMDEFTHYNYIYIGFYRLFDSYHFISIHGQPVEELYNDSYDRITHQGNIYICGALHKFGKWQNIRCDIDLHFVCQKKATV